MTRAAPSNRGPTHGRVLVVSGAGGGIGFTITRMATQAARIVVAVSRSKDKPRRTHRADGRGSPVGCARFRGRRRDRT